LPWPERQLSEAVLEPAAKAEPAIAAVANNAATNLSFFMFILKIDTTARLAARSESVGLTRRMIVPQSFAQSKACAITAAVNHKLLQLSDTSGFLTCSASVWVIREDAQKAG
jgi:hypothetical protein